MGTVGSMRSMLPPPTTLDCCCQLPCHRSWARSFRLKTRLQSDCILLQSCYAREELTAQAGICELLLST